MADPIPVCLCDGEGHADLAIFNRLQRTSGLPGAYTKSFTCTGEAHLGDNVYRCTSEWHNTQFVPVTLGELVENAKQHGIPFVSTPLVVDKLQLQPEINEHSRRLLEALCVPPGFLEPKLTAPSEALKILDRQKRETQALLARLINPFTREWNQLRDVKVRTWEAPPGHEPAGHFRWNELTQTLKWHPSEGDGTDFYVFAREVSTYEQARTLATAHYYLGMEAAAEVLRAFRPEGQGSSGS